MQFDHEYIADLTTRLQNHLSSPELGALFRQSFRLVTSMIKTWFCDEGHTRSLKVGASGCAGAEFGEWIYDLAWWNLDSHDQLIRQVLVLESECNPGNGPTAAANVDGDFQKLIQARADLRVWFCAVPNDDFRQRHISACVNQIHTYEQSNPDDSYILIIYSWADDNCSVTSLP